MDNKIAIILIYLTSILLLACFRPQDKHWIVAPVDTVLIRTAKISSINIDDTVKLHITAQNFLSPFHCTLTIKSKERDIYSKKWIDTTGQWELVDEFSNECHDTLECKRQWYFEDYLNYFLLPSSNPLPKGVIENGEPLYAAGFLRDSCGLEGTELTTAINFIRSTISAGQSTLVCLEPNAFCFTGFYIYVPQVKRFVFLWDD